MVALALPGMFFPVSLWAQDTADKAPAYNRLSVGLKAMHLYDLRFNSYDDLQNGFSGEDMFGLNGQKTRFDMAFGLEAAYQFSPVLSVDVYGAMGNMTGAISQPKDEQHRHDVAMPRNGRAINSRSGGLCLFGFG